MNLFIYTGASRLNAAVVESATDLTAVSRLPDLIVGDSEPVTVKFLSASGAYESWSGGGTYTLSISIGALGGDGIAAYFQTSSFTTVTNGWTGRLNLASGSLPSVVAGYLAERPGAQSVPLFVQVRVTDADGNTETYARQAVSISGAVSVPTTANSTPVTYATAADVAADASTASAAAIAAAASAGAAAGSASTAAGHVTTAGNSATAAAASAVTAGNSATTASGHATTATTQATNAATSASSASAYKDAAAVSASSATSSAGTATTQAALATTNGAAQVTLAAAQVTLATTQATNAGTSASAAAVSAAAALVSEAAALVSKNAAAASAATASAVSGSGNGTFSAAALTGVNSVTASASTALTLTGGSTGASLVLGQGTNGGSVTTLKGTGTFDISRTTTPELRLLGDASAGVSYVSFIADSSITKAQISAGKTGGTGGYLALSSLIGGVLTEGARLSATGNLLIGTTTDISGAGNLAVAGGTVTAGAAATSLTLSGGASGASLVLGQGTSGNLTVTSPGTFILFNTANTTGLANYLTFGASNRARIGGIIEDSTTGAEAVRMYSGTTSTGAVERARVSSTGNLLIGTTTDAASLAGGLVVNGSGAGAAASSTTTGALRVTGGVGVSGAGYFGGDVTRSGAGESLFIATTSNTASSGRIRLANTGAGGRTFDLMSSGSTAADPSLQSKFSIYDITQGAARMTIDSTGAATFGASPKTVTISGQQIIASGDTGPEFRVTRATSGIGGYVRYKTGATDDWVVGSGASGINSDYEVFSYGTSSVAFKLARDTAAATFAGAVTAGGVVVKKNYTVATLPAAASWTYGEAYVSDATQAAGTSLGSAPTGGGSVKRGVYSDGSSWLLR